MAGVTYRNHGLCASLDLVWCMWHRRYEMIEQHEEEVKDERVGASTN